MNSCRSHWTITSVNQSVRRFPCSFSGRDQEEWCWLEYKSMGDIFWIRSVRQCLFGLTCDRKRSRTKTANKTKHAEKQTARKRLTCLTVSLSTEEVKYLKTRNSLVTEKMKPDHISCRQETLYIKTLTSSSSHGWSSQIKTYQCLGH